MMRERTRIRIARAVALDLAGLKGPEIARRLGMKPKGLESLRARPEYKAQLVEVGNELIRRMDEALYESEPPSDPFQIRLSRFGQTSPNSRYEERVRWTVLTPTSLPTHPSWLPRTQLL